MASDEELALSVDDEKEEEFLLKHVNAIALMPAIGGRKITLLGRRIFNVLLHLSMANPDKEEHEAGLVGIMEMANFASRNYDQLKKTLRELMSTTVEWQSPAKNETVETWDACNLLSGVGITKNTKTGHITVRWRFDSKVRENILNPVIYSRLSLKSVTMFSSHGSMALYEICARYVKNPSHLTTKRNWRDWWMPVLTGAAKEKSKTEYRFFKRDVLKKAIAEVNSISNLIITGPIEFTDADGRTVNDIQFKVHYKEVECAQTPLVNTTEEELPVIGRAINLGIKQKDIEKLFTQYPMVLIVESLNELEERLNIPTDKVAEIKSRTAWLKTVIKKKSQLQEISPMAKYNPTDLKSQRAKWAKEWLQIQKDNLLYAFQDSSEEEQQATEKAFGEYLQETGKQILFESYIGFIKINEAPKPKSQINKNIKRMHLWEHRMLSSTFISYLGISQHGPDWDKPTAEDLLALAAKELAKE